MCRILFLFLCFISPIFAFHIDWTQPKEKDYNKDFSALWSRSSESNNLNDNKKWINEWEKEDSIPVRYFGNGGSRPTTPGSSVPVYRNDWRYLLEQYYGKGCVGQSFTTFLKNKSVKQTLTGVRTPNGVKTLRQWFTPLTGKRISSDWVTSHSPGYEPNGDVMTGIESELSKPRRNNLFGDTEVFEFKNKNLKKHFDVVQPQTSSIPIRYFGNADSMPLTTSRPSVLVYRNDWKYLLEEYYGKGCIGKSVTTFLRDKSVKQTLTEVRTPYGVKTLRQWFLPLTGKRISSDWVTSHTPGYEPRLDVMAGIESQVNLPRRNDLFGNNEEFSVENKNFKKNFGVVQPKNDVIPVRYFGNVDSRPAIPRPPVLEESDGKYALEQFFGKGSVITSSSFLRDKNIKHITTEVRTPSGVMILRQFFDRSTGKRISSDWVTTAFPGYLPRGDVMAGIESEIRKPKRNNFFGDNVKVDVENMSFKNEFGVVQPRSDSTKEKTTYGTKKLINEWKKIDAIPVRYFGNVDSKPTIPRPPVLEKSDGSYALEQFFGKGSVIRSSTTVLRDNSLKQITTEVKTPAGVMTLRQYFNPATGKRISSDWVTTHFPGYPPRGDVMAGIESEIIKPRKNSFFGDTDTFDVENRSFVETAEDDEEELISKYGEKERKRGPKKGTGGKRTRKPAKSTKKPGPRPPRTTRPPRTRGPRQATNFPSPRPTLPPIINLAAPVAKPRKLEAILKKAVDSIARVFEGPNGEKVQEVLTQVLTRSGMKIIRQYFNAGNGQFLGYGNVNQNYWDNERNSGGWNPNFGGGGMETNNSEMEESEYNRQNSESEDDQDEYQDVE